MSDLCRKYAIRFLLVLTAFIAVTPQTSRSQLNSNTATPTDRA